MKNRETLNVLLRFIFLLAIIVIVVPNRTARIALLSAVVILFCLVAFLLYKTKRTDEPSQQDNAPQYKVEFDDEKKPGPRKKKRHKRSGKK